MLKVKHDRTANLNLATLERCIEAVAANVILFSVRFGPFPLYDEMTPLSALVRQLFDLDMVGCDPTTFYVPWADFGTQRRRDLGCGDSREAARLWNVRPLTV